MTLLDRTGRCRRLAHEGNAFRAGCRPDRRCGISSVADLPAWQCRQRRRFTFMVLFCAINVIVTAVGIQFTV